MWLKDAVLSLFSDTQDCSPSLVKTFDNVIYPYNLRLKLKLS